jgi:predicted secreted Zn-dependent protease
MATDSWGRPVSEDGFWFWDGNGWQPRYGSSISAGPLRAKPKGWPSPSVRRGRRRAVAGLLAVVLLAALALGGVQVLRGNSSGLAVHQSQIAPMVAEVQDLRSRWFGTAALWRPPPIANTDIEFFTVKGATQLDLLNSLNTSNICAKYGGCQKDPAVPNGTAWGLEGFRLPSGAYYCNSPRTTTLGFREHIVIPQWSPPADGSVKIAVVEEWNALEKVIYTHEAGHVVITKQDLAALNSQAQRLSSCDAVNAFWANPHVFAKLESDQLAYHARLRADCRPEVGCLYQGWMGW